MRRPPRPHKQGRKKKGILKDKEWGKFGSKAQSGVCLVRLPMSRLRNEVPVKGTAGYGVTGSSGRCECVRRQLAAESQQRREKKLELMSRLGIFRTRSKWLFALFHRAVPASTRWGIFDMYVGTCAVCSCANATWDLPFIGLRANSQTRLYGMPLACHLPCKSISCRARQKVEDANWHLEAR